MSVREVQYTDARSTQFWMVSSILMVTITLRTEKNHCTNIIIKILSFALPSQQIVMSTSKVQKIDWNQKVMEIV